jgi:hypothetical protein
MPSYAFTSLPLATHVEQVEVRLVDSVSGHVLASHMHKSASGPVLAIRQENWLIYTYWNTVVRRRTAKLVPCAFSSTLARSRTLLLFNLPRLIHTCTGPAQAHRAGHYFPVQGQHFPVCASCLPRSWPLLACFPRCRLATASSLGLMFVFAYVCVYLRVPACTCAVLRAPDSS